MAERDRDPVRATSTPDGTQPQPQLAAGKRTLTEQLPAFPDIDLASLEQDAELEPPEPEPEAKQQQPSDDEQLAADEDALVGILPRSNKASFIVYDNKKFMTIRGAACRLKVELEASSVSSGGVNRETDTTPTVGLLATERKGELDRAKRQVAASLKTALVTGRAKFCKSLGIDLKLFEASHSTETHKQLRDLLTVGPSVDLAKLSGFASVSELFPNLPVLAELRAAGVDLKVKAELSVPLTSLLPAAELDDLKKLATKVDDAIKRMDDIDRKIFDGVDDSIDDISKRMASSRYRKGALGKKHRISKQELRSLLKEIDELKVPKGKSKMYTRVASHMVRKRVGSKMARIALKCFTKLTRLIPVIGWAMLIYDVLELGYLAYKVYNGQAKFLGGGDSVSLLDIFKSDEPSPDGKAPEDGDDDTEMGKLDAEARAKLLDAGSPLGRLIKGIATQMPDGDVKVEHLTRLIQIAESRQLTHDQVTEVLKRVLEDGPPASSDRILDMLERILDTLVPRPVDRDGDGIPDGDGDGDGDGNGLGDGKGKGDGKGPGKGPGRGKKPGTSPTPTETTERIFELAEVLRDPVGLGLISVQMTAGGLTDPEIIRDRIMTRAGLVTIVGARFLGGHQKPVKNDDGSMTMQIRVEFKIDAGKTTNQMKLSGVQVRSYHYGWFKDAGLMLLSRAESVSDAVARALANKLTAGGTDNVDFEIVDRQRAQGGWNVKIKITAVRGVILFTEGVTSERLLPGTTQTIGISDSDVDAMKRKR